MIDVIRELQSYGVEVIVHDPVAESKEAEHEYGVSLTDWDAIPKVEAIVAAVSHKEFAARPLSDYVGKLKAGGVLADIKYQFDTAALEAQGVSVWRL